MIGPYNRRVLAVAGFVAAFLVVLVARDRLAPNVVSLDVPNLPANEKAVFATTSFAGVWRAAFSHIDGDFDSLNYVSGDMLSTLSDISRRGCMQGGEATDFDRLGLDSSRSAVVALYGPLSNLSRKLGVLAVLPVKDAKAFEDFARRLEFNDPVQLLMTALDGSKPINQIRVDEVSVSPGSFACWDDGSPIEAGEAVAVESWSEGRYSGAMINVKRNPNLESTFHIKCTAIDANGQSIECGCRNATDNNLAESSSKDECDWAPARNEESERQPQFTSVGGKSYPLLRPLDLWASIADSGYAILASDRALLERALAAPPRHRDLTYPSGAPASESSDGDLVGEVMVAGPVLASRVPVAIRFSSGSIRLQASLKLIRGDTRVLQSLLEEETVAPVPTVRGAVAAISLDGRQGSRLLRFVNRWIPDFQNLLNTALGDMSVAMQRLAEADSLDSVKVVLLGMREGIPQLAVMARLPEQDAQSLIEEVQREMKVKRDTALIDAAIAKAGGAPASVADLVQEGFLQPEDGTNWNDYAIDEGHAAPPKEPINVRATTAYRAESEGQAIDFLMPPFTTNDYAVRFENKEEAEKVNKEGLFAGRYRLAAMYVAKDGLLWIGNEAATLQLLLDNQEPPRLPAENAAATRHPGTRKVTFFALPDLLLGLGQVHPDESIASGAQGLSQLQRYRLLSGTANAHNDRQEIEINVDLTR